MTGTSIDIDSAQPKEQQYEPLSMARSTVALLSLAVSLIYIGPLLLYSANEADFSHFSSSRFLSAIAPIALKALLAIGLLIGISQLIKSRRIRLALDVSLLFTAATVISFVCYLPLSVGKLDGVDGIGIDIVNLAIGLVIGAVTVYWRSKGSAIFLLILIGPFTTSTLALFEPYENASASASFQPFSRSQKNVLLVSLDNLQSSHVARALDADATSFDGFVFYPEVTAVGPFSALSTLTTKMGQLPDLPEGRKASVFFRDRFITSKLYDAGFDVETYGDFGQAEAPTTSKLPYFSHINSKPKSSYVNMLEMSLLRVVPAPELVSIGFELLWPALAWPTQKQATTESEDGLAVLTENDRHPLAHYKLDVLQFDAFVHSIDAADVGPTARLHHYLFTHEPIRFSENCNFVYGTGFRYVTALPAETACAIGKIKTLLAKLKAVGVYDNTMIIFASDHGPECPLNFTFEPGSYRVSKRWCLSRYQPFLMIKDFEGSGELTVNANQTSLLDIAKTICAAALPETACESYSGADLLDSTKRYESTKRHILVSKSSEDRRDYNSFSKLEIPRDQSLIDYFDINPEEHTKVFPAKDLPSRTGTIVDGKRSASPGDSRGFATHGPYAHLWPGSYSISVVYSLSNDDAVSASHWEITSERGAKKLFKAPLKDTQGQPTQVTYALDAAESVANIELRTFYGGQGYLTIESVIVERHLDK